MCINKKYRIYHSKRRSLKIVSRWRISSHSTVLYEYDNPNPILLTLGLPLSVAQELANSYGTCLIINSIEGFLHEVTVLVVYSKDMAMDLVQNYNSRVVVRR